MLSANKTATAFLSCALLLGNAARAADDSPILDCPLRDAPFSADSPLFDLLLSDAARAVLAREIPELNETVPPILRKEEAPSLAAIVSLRTLAAGGRIPEDEMIAADHALLQLEVSDADRAARCARYDADPPEFTPPAKDAPVKLLVFHKINGFDHGPSVDAATQAVKKLATAEGWAVRVTDRGGAFTPETLAQFDAVIWNNVSGDVLTLSQRRAFEDYIESGGGYAGMHGSGGDSVWFWDWYAEDILGAQFIGHPDEPQFQDATVMAEPTASGISADLPHQWTMHDEWYSFAASPRLAGAAIVASLDERSYAPEMSGRDLTMGDHPIAWTRCVADGRAFYSAIGHRSDVYKDKRYMQLLTEGIRWAAGKGKTECGVKGEGSSDFTVLAAEFAPEVIRKGKLKGGELPPFKLVIDPINHIDPDLRQAARPQSIPAPGSAAAVAKLKENFEQLIRPLREQRKDASAKTLPEFRKYSASWGEAPLPEPPVEEKRIPGAPGQPEVLIYIINAKPGQSRGGEARPAMLHTHGGGYILGAAASSVFYLQKMAAEYDIPIVTVDYRLAPETPFPGSLEDNYAALKWLHANADALGADPARIVLMGESAGGGHAAALAIAARDRGEVPVSRQLLIYPMLDDRTGSSVPVPNWLGYYGWTPASNRFGWSSLLGARAGAKKAPLGSVPARVEDLSGLPPAFIIVGTADLFVLEDVAYGQRLMQAGVPTELVVVPGAYHGSEGQPAPSSKMFNEARDEAFARAFAH